MVRLAAALALVAFAFGANAVQAITFADGQVHVIDAANSYPLEDVIVQDGGGASTTTLQVVDGGRVATEFNGRLRAGGRSLISISGGMSNVVLAHDQAVVQISGGFAEGIELYDSSHGEVSAGELINLEAFDASDLRLTDGVIQNDLVVGGSAHLDVSGGTVGAAVGIREDATVRIAAIDVGGVLGATGSSMVEITGGTFGGRFLIGDPSRTSRAQVLIRGGAVTMGITARMESSVEIRGGTIETDLLVLEASSLTLLGQAFNLPPGEVAAASGTIDGTLSDGSPVSVSFNRASTARIVLIQDIDSDGDGLFDGIDNCQHVENGDQSDTDSDRIGDACNDAQDADDDEWADALDNCLAVANASQTDRDLDLLGDACDHCPDYRSSNNNDFDHNAIGDPCECGDQTQDATVNVLDLVAINFAIFGSAQVSPLCDANNDAKCNVSDIVAANQKIFGRPAYCSRYPPPGP